MDTTWFAQLYADFYPKLVLIALARTGERTEAEEVAQEAFVRGYASAAKLAKMAAPEAWLCTVAFNVIRRRGRRQRFLHVIGRETPAEVLAPRDSAESIDLYRALQRLPVEFREPVVLHYLADLPLEQISELLNTPIGTVKSRLHRGRQALAAALSEKERSEP